MLLCFNNGVYDFEMNKFRNGLPKYISLSTNNDYVEINEQNSKHRDDG